MDGTDISKQEMWPCNNNDLLHGIQPWQFIGSRIRMDDLLAYFLVLAIIVFPVPVPVPVPVPNPSPYLLSTVGI